MSQSAQRRKFLTLILLGAGTLAGCGGSQSPRTPAPSLAESGDTAQPPPPPVVLRIAAAADLQTALAELAEVYEARHPGARLEPTFGSSGNFFAQISNGAPFDVFLSANRDYPARLCDDKLARPETLTPYATGRLALWVARDSALDIEGAGLAALTDERARRIALANPQHAPYGQAAMAALEGAGLAQSLAERLVLGESVGQAAQFVESGAADAGLVALSLALAPRMRRLGRHLTLPADSHPPLAQFAVVVAKSLEAERGAEFCRFLRSAEAQSVLERWGFGPPGE